MRLNMPWKLVAEYRTPITFWMFPMVIPTQARSHHDLVKPLLAGVSVKTYTPRATHRSQPQGDSANKDWTGADISMCPQET